MPPSEQYFSPEHAIAEAEAIYQQLKLGLQQWLLSQAETAPALMAPVMVGIHTGGYSLAQRLHQELSLSEPLGALNIAFHRDDFATSGLSAEHAASQLPIDIAGRDVLLVDDILYTGRTVRAALNELFDFGRAKSITLVCLLARNGRELPVQPDICGGHVQLASKQVIKLTAIKPIELRLEQRP